MKIKPWVKPTVVFVLVFGFFTAYTYGVLEDNPFSPFAWICYFFDLGAAIVLADAARNKNV